MLITRILYKQALQALNKKSSVPESLINRLSIISDPIDRVMYVFCSAFYSRKPLTSPNFISFVALMLSLSMIALGLVIGNSLLPDNFLHSTIRYEILYMGYAALLVLIVTGLKTLIQSTRTGIALCALSLFLTGLMLSIHSWPVPVIQWPHEALIIDVGFSALLGLDLFYLLPVRFMIATFVAIVLFRVILMNQLEIPSGFLFVSLFIVIEILSFPILVSLLYFSSWSDLTLQQAMVIGSPLSASALSAYFYIAAIYPDLESSMGASIALTIAAVLFNYITVKFAVSIITMTSPRPVIYYANTYLTATSHPNDVTISDSSANVPRPVFTVSFEMVVFLSVLAAFLPLLLLIEIVLLFLYLIIRYILSIYDDYRAPDKDPDTPEQNSLNPSDTLINATLGNPKNDKIALWMSPLLAIFLLPFVNKAFIVESNTVQSAIIAEHSASNQNLLHTRQSIIDQAHANNPLSIVLFPNKSSQFDVNVMINGAETTMLVDTGADTILGMQFAMQNDLAISRIEIPVLTPGGMTYVSKCMMSTFEMGGLRFANHIEISCARGLDEGRSDGFHLLGIDILRFFDIVIQPTHMTLTLKPEYENLWTRTP